MCVCDWIMCVCMYGCMFGLCECVWTYLCVLCAGEPIECYIMTGARGARCIRERILRSDHLVHLRERIDEILIVLPGKKGSGYEVEVTPLVLYHL